MVTAVKIRCPKCGNWDTERDNEGDYECWMCGNIICMTEPIRHLYGVGRHQRRSHDNSVIACPNCESENKKKDGWKGKKQKYRCKDCGRHFQRE